MPPEVSTYRHRFMVMVSGRRGNEKKSKIETETSRHRGKFLFPFIGWARVARRVGRPAFMNILSDTTFLEPSKWVANYAISV